MSKSNLNSRKTTAEDRYNACIGYFSRYPLLLCEKLILTLKVSRIRLLGAFQLHLTILIETARAQIKLGGGPWTCCYQRQAKHTLEA